MDDDAKRVDSLAEDEVLQRGPEGYRRTKVSDIPLSDKTGEGRRDEG